MRLFLKSREAQLILALLGLVAIIAFRFPRFIVPSNLAAIFNDTSILIILALGQMTVILSRCIDLSVAANLAFSGMVVALLNSWYPGTPVPLLVILAIAVGTILGAINGLLVWKLDIPSIVVTLGTLTIYRGMIFVISSGKWVNSGEMTEGFIQMQRALFLGVPLLTWFALIVIAIMAILLTRTPLGRAFYAIGGNPTASVYVGINVGQTRFAAFTICGALAGFSGYLWVTRYAVAYVDLAPGFELDVIAACVIGGVSIAGGIGSVGGAVLGALFLGIVKNALPVVNISPFWQMAISGAVIIIAVSFNTRTEAKKGRIILKAAEAKS
jgi:rhamnose transport system permease protein